jgi:virginiamycin B lyase
MRRNALYGIGLLATIVLLVVPSARAAVYWDETGSLGAASLDGSHPNPKYLLFRGAGGPTCDVAVTATHLYWCEWFGIWRVNLEGPAVPTRVVSGLDNPSRIAVGDSHLYWANRGGGSIGRAALDGSAREDSFISGLNEPAGVAVDDRYLYWATFNEIGRARLDGTGIEKAFVETIPIGSGLAVDQSHLYWSAGRAIGRARVTDGAGVDPAFITGVDHVGGIAVDSGRIYWINTPEGMHYSTIGRAGIDGSDVNKSWIPTQKFNATGVAVDGRPSPPPLPLPSRPFYIGKLSHSLEDGSAILNIGVPERGDLVVNAPGIGWKVNKGPTPPPYHHGSFTWRLKIWPGKTRFGKKIRTRLRNKGRAPITLHLTYAEEGQLPASTVKRIVLRQNNR